MSKLIRRKKALIKFFFLFILLLLAFNFPILSIFNVPQNVKNIPLLYLYIFVLWFIAILLIALMLERHNRHKKNNDPPKL